MQLFRNEFSDRSEKIHPKLSQVARDIFIVYIFFTVLCCILLLLAGMPLFEAICHALSTLSTGGFSTSSQSIGSFENPIIEAIIMMFMMIGAMTLLLFVRILQNDYKSLLIDSQVQAFLAIIIISIAAVTFWRLSNGSNFWISVRESSFAVISTISTTGYHTSNFNYWGAFPLISLLILMQIGGCTGSTAGGVKVFRYQILFAVARAHIAQMRRPHGIFIARYNGKQIPEGVFTSVFTFLGLYALSISIVSLGLAFYNLDFMTCIASAISVLNNVGVTIGPLVGPEGTFASLPDGAKWILILGMLLGRLEYVTVIILFSRTFWRN